LRTHFDDEGTKGISHKTFNCLIELFHTALLIDEALRQTGKWRAWEMVE
jgi:hypothetical protein